MADTVNTIVLRNSDTFYSAQFMNYSDGTGESAVKKIDVSTLTGPNGATTTKLQLLEAHWSITGTGTVTVYWDATTDDEMLQLAGNGYLDLRGFGGSEDPQTTGYTGDVMFTTNDFAAGSGYNIVLHFRKKN